MGLPENVYYWVLGKMIEDKDFYWEDGDEVKGWAKGEPTR